MVRRGAKTSQAAGHFGGSCCHSGIRRITQDADKAIHRYRTCRPSALSIPSEPAVRVFVIAMRGIEERYQDIYVQQRDTQASSRNSFTMRRLDVEARALGTKSGAPFRTFKGSRAASDCRASSEMTLPSVSP